MLTWRSWFARKLYFAYWHVTRYIQYVRWKYGPVRPSSKPHGLHCPIVVSLTSYPSRFSTLPLTLKCLLSQTVKPDTLVLWIAEGDKEVLTPEIKRLQAYGLLIRFCEDIKSYKKIIPSLAAFPNSFIVTADDDIIYPQEWLEMLVREYRGDEKEVICHRAHRIRLGQDGYPLKYCEWEFQTQGPARSPLLFPTSGAGVLYPPGIFDARVNDMATFMSLCSTADDMWLYWMASLNGGCARLIGTSRVAEWPVRNTEKLSSINLETENDLCVKRLIRIFGFSVAT